MVKKIATLLLFVALIIIAFLQYFYIRNSSEDYVALGKKAAEYAEADDMDNAYKEVQTLYGKWAKKKDGFEAMMEHNETDKISMSMEKTLSYASQKDKVNFLAEISELTFLLDHIHEIDSLSWENIL